MNKICRHLSNRNSAPFNENETQSFKLVCILHQRIEMFNQPKFSFIVHDSFGPLNEIQIHKYIHLVSVTIFQWMLHTLLIATFPLLFFIKQFLTFTFLLVQVLEQAEQFAMSIESFYDFETFKLGIESTSMHAVSLIYLKVKVVWFFSV